MNLSTFSCVYLIGIGGIGMSALARWFRQKGKKVAGYDKTSTLLTQQLQQEGISIHYEDNPAHIPHEFLHAETTLVVYTPAIPQEHQELRYFQKNGFTVLKRAQALGVITQAHPTVAVAGTHGKTTTSSLIAHILTQAGKNCTAFLGGITVNYQTNLLLGDAQKGDEIIVVEADEYDRSFLHLTPCLSIITNVEADHLDIYGTEQAVQEAFYAFMLQNHPDGIILLNHRVYLPQLPSFPFSTKIIRYGKNTDTFLVAQNIRVENGKFHFDLTSPTFSLSNIALQIVGEHNVENATAAAYACHWLGVSSEAIRKGLETFKGVKRRFEYIVRNEKHIFIDDYAHHPTEIKAFIGAVRAIFPQKKLTLIFQPHLYTRTRDFADEFARSLSLADEVLLLDIYPARELPIAGVSSQMLLEKICASKKRVVSKSFLLEYIAQERPPLLATVGAGDIDALVPLIKDVLEN